MDHLSAYSIELSSQNTEDKELARTNLSYDEFDGNLIENCKTRREIQIAYREIYTYTLTSGGCVNLA